MKAPANAFTIKNLLRPYAKLAFKHKMLKGSVTLRDSSLTALFLLHHEHQHPGLHDEAGQVVLPASHRVHALPVIVEQGAAGGEVVIQSN